MHRNERMTIIWWAILIEDDINVVYWQVTLLKCNFMIAVIVVSAIMSKVLKYVVAAAALKTKEQELRDFTSTDAGDAGEV